MKEFSLFTAHDAPIEVKPIEEPIVVPKKKVNLYSEAAVRLIKKNQNSTHQNKMTAASHIFKDFNLDTCRSCGSTKLIKYDNVYVCKTCGSENTSNGVLFGDKLKKREK